MVGGRIIGAREFARYYRQRPRPVESRAITVAAASAGGSRRVGRVASCYARLADAPHSSLLHQGACAGAGQERQRAILPRAGSHSPGATPRDAPCPGTPRLCLTHVFATPSQHARVQRVEQRTSARLRMMTEMSANGPQFRGFRDA